MKYLLFLLFSQLAFAQLTGPTVQGPASSTLNAMPLWNSTDGTILKDSTFLYDGSSVAGGLTATFKPTVTGTSKVYGAPDIAGNFLVNGGFDTFNNTYMGEGLTWFNNSDSSKRFLFNLGTEATGKTVTFNITSPLVGTAGSTGAINFPAFGAGQTSITLLKSNLPTLNQAAIADFLDMNEEAVNLPLGVYNHAGIRVLDNEDNIDYYNGDGKLVHGTGLVRTELDFGSTPLTEKSFTITDTSSEATDASIGFANMVDAMIERTTSTGKTYVDETDMDSFFVSCTPGSGSIVCLVRCLTGQFRGTLSLNYRIVMVAANF